MNRCRGARCSSSRCSRSGGCSSPPPSPHSRTAATPRRPATTTSTSTRARSRPTSGRQRFKFAATPDPGNAAELQPGRARRRPRRPRRRCGRARRHRLAVTTGRPDVTIAVLDSGIKWNDAGDDGRPAQEDPPQQGRAADAAQPRRPGAPNEAGEDCSGAGPYAHAGDGPERRRRLQPRRLPVRRPGQTDSPNSVGPAGMLDPQDLIIAFATAPTTTATATSTTSPAGTSSTTTTTPSTTSSTATAPARPRTRAPRPTTAATSAPARTAW